MVPVLARNIWLEEGKRFHQYIYPIYFFPGEIRRYLTKETARDQKLAQVVDLLIYWLNEELADQRIVVRHLQEDLFDGQIIQKLLEKLEQIRVSYWYNFTN